MSITIRVIAMFYLSLKILTQLLCAPLYKNCRISHEIEVGNIARLVLLSQATSAEVNGKQPAARYNFGACSE